ncbi:MAG: hypothetical protein Pars2KO_11450 [Parasphingorhabdus sp.]
MSKFIKAAVASSVLAASVMGAGAAHAATASADASANILEQIQIDKTSDLGFGTIVTGTTASTVAIAADGSRSCGTVLVCSGATSAAGFNVTAGTIGRTVNVSADTSVTLTNPDGDTMTASLSPSVATIVLDGTDSFSVGGTLNVDANQADGLYEGSFDVTVNYQ